LIRSRVLVSTGFVFAITVLLLAACGSTVTVTGNGSPTATGGGGGTTPTATAVQNAGALCSAVYVSATPTTTITASGFTDVPLPASSSVTASQPVTGGDMSTVGSGLWTRSTVNVCTEGTAPAAITAFYQTHMSTSSWSATALNKAPFDGNYQEPCAAHNAGTCWQKDAAPRYVALQSVTDAGHGASTFTLEFFTPPPTPTCSTNIASSLASLPYVNFTQLFNSYVPWPSLTKILPNNAAGGMHGYVICSAGSTGLDIASIIDINLPKEGWTFVSGSVIPGGVDQTWKSSTSTIHLNIVTPTEWELDYRAV